MKWPGVEPGFLTLGWAPEGQVYFSYEANADGSGAYNVVAEADIDGDSSVQLWGYFNDSDYTTNTKGCDSGVQAGAAWSTVGPCEFSYGQSVF